MAKNKSEADKLYNILSLALQSTPGELQSIENRLRSKGASSYRECNRLINSRRAFLLDLKEQWEKVSGDTLKEGTISEILQINQSALELINTIKRLQVADNIARDSANKADSLRTATSVSSKQITPGETSLKSKSVKGTSQGYVSVTSEIVRLQTDIAMSLIQKKYFEKQTARERRVAKRDAERAQEDAAERSMEQLEQIERKQEELKAQLAIIESLRESNSQGVSSGAKIRAFLDSFTCDVAPSECAPKQITPVHEPVISVEHKLCQTDQAIYPIYTPSPAPVPSQIKNSGRDNRSKRRGSFAVDNSRVPSGGRGFGACRACEGSHSIHDCNTFKNKHFDERHNLIKEKWLCFGCLGKGHMVRDCENPMYCTSCRGPHPSIMHREHASTPHPRTCIAAKNRVSEKRTDSHSREPRRDKRLAEWLSSRFTNFYGFHQANWGKVQC